MAFGHRCIDIENRKTAGNDNPLAVFVWFFIMLFIVVQPIGGWSKLFLLGITYIACQFFIRGTARDMYFYKDYNFSANTYTATHEDEYTSLRHFCSHIQQIADDGTPMKKEGLFN